MTINTQSPINSTCLHFAEYETAKNKYRAEAFRYLNRPDEQFVYTGYVLKFGHWEKVPCFSRGEENRYPKKLAAVGTELVAKANNQTLPDLELILL